jgi:hypothetical protein
LNTKILKTSAIGFLAIAVATNDVKPDSMKRDHSIKREKRMKTAGFQTREYKIIAPFKGTLRKHSYRKHLLPLSTKSSNFI